MCDNASEGREQPLGGAGPIPAPVEADGGAEMLTAIFAALTEQRRRYVLYYLQDQSGPVEAEELARQVRAWEQNTSVGSVSDDDCADVLTDLYHNHLPRLSESGLIDYDSRTLTARSWEHSELFNGVISFAKQLEGEIGM